MRQRDPWALQHGLRDDAVDRELAAVAEQHVPGARDLGVGPAGERDPGAVEQPGDRARRGFAEDRKRHRLGRHEVDLDAVHAHPARLGGGHERELVGGQRPGDAGRHHEGHGAAVALLEVARMPFTASGSESRPNVVACATPARGTAPAARTSAS